MAYSYPDRTRILWVDSICINQADTAEKSQQVAIMADIYSMAKTVQVWLSLASDWATDAMEFMADLSSKAESFGISGEVDQPRLIETWPCLNISNEEAKVLIHDAIEAHVDFLLLHSWFHRVWVVQEVAFATKLVVSCGHTNMDWTAFARALEVLRGAFRQVPKGGDRSRIEGIKPAWGLVRFRDAFRLLGPVRNRNHHDMTNLIGKLMSNNACSDDRDRVYAMLAMTTSPYSMTADYNKTVAEAYTEFTGRYSPNTQIYWAGLSRRQPQPNPEGADTTTKNDQQPPIDITDRNYLPSWVPEFRPSLNLAWGSPICGGYCTAPKDPFYFLWSAEIPKVMMASGTLFDIIEMTSKEYEAKSEPHLAFEPGFYFSIIDLLQDMSCAPNLKLKPNSEPSWLIVAKTLTGGTSECDKAEFVLSRYRAFQGLSHLQPGSLPWLTAIWDCFATHCLAPTGEVFQHVLLRTLGVESRPLSADGSVAMGFLVYVANILAVNRLFVTCEGYVGLTSNDIRCGDFVAVFNGCHMPYVVRAAGRVKCKGKMKYKGKVKIKGKIKKKKEKMKIQEEQVKRAIQVLCPCYLHGIMKGEIFKNRDAPQFSWLKWTRYDGDEADSLEGWLALI
ncbi:heterokaryon incompatibility protein-domain-containing protein [Xylariaceae sp. AK1471]|nr:heterokaryon incompatibility protein-domain-containing protein [Xylariaceae sp. AK1471]